MDLKNQRVLVVGLGKSGVASALFLQARGAHVTVSDAKPQDQLGEDIPVLLDHGIAVETGGHGERTFRGQDLIVVSPGVPLDSPALVQARALGEPVIGEIELASRFLPKNVVAITGSNGKTTTTSLTGEIVAAGGFPTAVGAHQLLPHSARWVWGTSNILFTGFEANEPRGTALRANTANNKTHCTSPKPSQQPGGPCSPCAPIAPGAPGTPAPSLPFAPGVPGALGTGALLRTTSSISRPTSRMKMTNVNTPAPISACHSTSRRMYLVRIRTFAQVYPLLRGCPTLARFWLGWVESTKGPLLQRAFLGTWYWILGTSCY